MSVITCGSFMLTPPFIWGVSPYFELDLHFLRKYQCLELK